MRGDWHVGLLAALPALIALAIFGAIETPDSGGYISFRGAASGWAVAERRGLARQSARPGVACFEPPDTRL